MHPVDFLRKSGAWLWAGKERLVLLLTCIVLCVQIYRVFFSSADAEKLPPIPSPPKSPTAGAGAEDISIPEIPTDIYLEDADSVIVRNMWWFYSKTGDDNIRDKKTEQDPGIRLLRIHKWPDGTYRAELKTKATGFYKEGEKFESFELVSIDPDENTVEVYVEALGRRVTLEPE